MKTVPLFGSNDSSPNKNNLLEFRAGKMNTKSNQWVHPDDRSGLVFITRSEEGLLQFCWKCRTTGVVEDNFVVFPNDAHFYHIDKCKTGRVYLLYFSEAKTKHFYWLQEPSTLKDLYYCERVNSFLNQTSESSGATERTASNGGASLPDVHSYPSGMDSFLGSLSNNDLMHLLTSMQGNVPAGLSDTAIPGILPSQEGTTSTTRKTGNAKSTKWIELSDLQNVLNAIPSTNRGESRNPRVDLTRVLTYDAFVNRLEQSAELRQRVLRCLSHEDKEKAVTQEDEMKIIRENFKDGNFLQTLRIISDAFHRGEMGPVLEQFNFPQSVRDLAPSGNFIRCAEEMEKALKVTPESAASPADNEKMEVDQPKEEPVQHAEQPEPLADPATTDSAANDDATQVDKAAEQEAKMDKD